MLQRRLEPGWPDRPCWTTGLGLTLAARFALVRGTGRNLWPVSTGPPPEAAGSRRDPRGGEPHADSFALDEAGRILLSALRDWTRDSPTTAVLGTARSIIRFVENVIPDPDDHADTRATLEAMRDEHLKWARTVQSMTAHP